MRTGGKQEYRLLALPGWFAALIVGLLVLAGLVPGTRGAGVLCALMGAGGCVWELNYWAHKWREQRQIVERARVQAARKVKRQARQTQQNNRQKQQKAIQAQAYEKQEQQLRKARQEQTQQMAEEDAQRAARFARVAAEAERLQRLDSTAFSAEAGRIFDLHHQSWQQTETTCAGTIHAALASDENRVYLWIPPDAEPITVAHVKNLELWRLESGAVRAYLIGRSGFTPAAVRLAQRFPITFVEPQLLAQWKITDGEEKEK